MATDNNSQINSFAAGMDSDSSIDRIAEGSYLIAKNLRIVQYDKGSKNGSIAPISGIKLAGRLVGEKVYKVLAAGSIRQYGVIIYISQKGLQPEFCVARFENSIGGSKDTSWDYNQINPTVIFRSKLIDWPEDKSKWPNAVSIAFKYEDQSNIKLYIATSLNPILVLNIAKTYDSTYDMGTISSYPSVMFNKPVFNKYIAGAMNPGLVSYSYQLYNDYGTATDISPACQQIPVANISSDDYTDVVAIQGQNYGKESSCGIQIKVPAITSETLGSTFKKIKIYRITVHQNGQIPTIEIIYDSVYSKLGEDFVFNDVGQEAIDQITPEEYNSMSGVHIIPNSIENKDQMLFAANVTEKQTFLDDTQFKNWDARAYRRNSSGSITLQDLDSGRQETYTDIVDGWQDSGTIYEKKIIKDAYNPYNDVNKQVQSYESTYCVYDKDGYYGGDGVNVSWRFVLTYIPIDTCKVDDGALHIGTLYNVLKQQSGLETPKCFFISKNGLVDAGLTVSDEPGRLKESWLTKSLRRNELYRYGIILYDKTGNPSPVKWITDIRTPNLYDQYFNTFISHYKAQDGNVYDLASLPLGVAFKVKNLPDDCTGYEIVRCVRREQDIATVSQGVISKPIVKYFDPSSRFVKSSLYFPTGLLTTAMIAQGTTFNYFWEDFCNDGGSSSAERYAQVCATNFGNNKILQFVSPEVVYQPESMKTVFKGKDYKVEQLRYVFGSSAAPLNGQYKCLSQLGKNLTKYYLRPSISNLNLFTMPGGHTSTSDKWKYFYLDENGDVATMDYKADPYMLKMETQSTWGIYYKAAPFLYAASDSIVGQVINMLADKKWGYSSAGKLDNPILSSHKRDISTKVFSYIKLYEQANNLSYVTTDPKDQFKQTGIVSNTQISHSEELPTINSIDIATDLQWNEVFKMAFEAKGVNSDTKENGRWWPQAEYKNHIDSVGQYQFANAVMYGTDGALIDKGGKLGDDDWTYAQDLYGDLRDDAASEEYTEDRAIGQDYPTMDGGKNYTLSAPYAAGGRCAVLQLDEYTNKNQHPTLTNILGANSYLYNSNNTLQNSTSQCTYNGVNIESIAGTSLCNIRKDVTPYGGFSEDIRSRNVYYSTGQYFKASNSDWNAVFDGDVVISVLDYTSMHKAVCALLKDSDDSIHVDPNDYRTQSMMVGYAIPVESTINCRLSSGAEFSRESSGDGLSLVQVQPSNIDGLYSQTEPEYVYNTAYSAEDKTRVHAAFDTENIADFNKTIDYRVRNSNLKENNEHIDSWTKFQSSNFLDVDTQYGPITNMRDFKEQLVFWQQKALGKLSVNERAITTDENDNSITLGSGGVLARYDYADNTSGMHEQEFCDGQSDTTLYWFDHHNNEIKCYNGGSMISLTKKFSVQSMINAYREANQSPKIFFDTQCNEVVNKVLTDSWSLVYNENVNKFTSIYDIQFDESVTFPNGTYIIKGDDDLNIAQWNADNQYTTTWNDKVAKTYLQYAVNKYPTATKVFDDQEIITPQDECQIVNREYEDAQAYFSYKHKYKWSTESQQASDNLKNKVTLREHNYRFAIPRQEDSGLYGSRMRGKYLKCYIEDDKPNTNVAVQYIITKFRTSWS